MNRDFWFNIALVVLLSAILFVLFLYVHSLTHH